MFVFVLLRALTYSALFIGFLLVYLPSGLVGIARPPSLGAASIAGMAITAVGGLLTVWCILAFVFIGRGTPLPLDPPRRLVVRGPYHLVRNPMYLGAGLALVGAAVAYGSLALAAYAAGFFAVMHAFVVFHEEPTLRRTFGDDYAAYCRRTRRWWPIRRRSS